MEAPKYKRVLLKISGEALAGDERRGLNFDDNSGRCHQRMYQPSVQVERCEWRRNFWRGKKDGGDDMQRVRADHMGMLATVINALAVADVLERKEVDVRVQTAIEMKSIAEFSHPRPAVRHLKRAR